VDTQPSTGTFVASSTSITPYPTAGKGSSQDAGAQRTATASRICIQAIVRPWWEAAALRKLAKRTDNVTKRAEFDSTPGVGPRSDVGARAPIAKETADVIFSASATVRPRPTDRHDCNSSDTARPSTFAKTTPHFRFRYKDAGAPPYTAEARLHNVRETNAKTSPHIGGALICITRRHPREAAAEFHWIYD